MFLCRRPCCHHPVIRIQVWSRFRTNVGGRIDGPTIDRFIPTFNLPSDHHSTSGSTSAIVTLSHQVHVIISILDQWGSALIRVLWWISILRRRSKQVNKWVRDHSNPLTSLNSFLIGSKHCFHNKIQTSPHFGHNILGLMAKHQATSVPSS